MCLLPASLWTALADNHLKPTLTYDQYNGENYCFYSYHGPFQQDHEAIGGGQLYACPGNDNILISGDSWINHAWKGMGYGKQKNTLVVKAAKQAGYQLLLCTVRLDNTKQNAIMHKNGWKQGAIIGATSAIWTKDLT